MWLSLLCLLVLPVAWSFAVETRDAYDKDMVRVIILKSKHSTSRGNRSSTVSGNKHLSNASWLIINSSIGRSPHFQQGFKNHISMLVKQNKNKHSLDAMLCELRNHLSNVLKKDVRELFKECSTRMLFDQGFR